GGFRMPPPDVLEKLRTGLHVHATDDSGRDDPKPTNTAVAAIWDGHALVQKAMAEQTVALVLRKTPFYAESGGQVGDTGIVECGRGTAHTHRFAVEDTQRAGEYVLHVGHSTQGAVTVGDDATATVERARRERVAANHTATHLMNHALREVLGGDVEQRGSLVADDRLRFDFTHGRAMTPDEVGRVEVLVNAAIARTLPVHHATVPLDRARAISGVRAVFGERYPDPVRVVAIGATVEDMLADPSNARWRGLSIEFCGGTHLRNAEQAQHFAIVGEGASSAGIRRIFAITAASIEQRLAAARRHAGEALAAELAAIAAEVAEAPLSVSFRHRIEPALAELREKVKDWRKAQEGANRDAVVAQARDIADRASGAVIVEPVEGADPAALLSALSAVRAKRPAIATLPPASSALRRRMALAGRLARTALSAESRAAGSAPSTGSTITAPDARSAMSRACATTASR
ncbi:MAG: alanine--tRNA ligase-related protein, partial [Phycisphaerales bacterium]